MTTLPSRIGRMRLPTLCFIIDRNQCGKTEPEEVMKAAIAGGANVVQLREKDLPAAELFSLGTRLRELSRGKALLLINDRVDVAQAAGADGVHLPENGVPTAMARWILGRHTIIGKSVHSVEAAKQAERDGADFVQFGTVFASSAKKDVEPVGLDVLQEVAAAVSIPVLAVGGVTADNAGKVIEAGAGGASVISAICKSKDPKATTESIIGSMTDAWQKRSGPKKVAS
jgi:thiamine-phosphate pyrophosphorylase